MKDVAIIDYGMGNLFSVKRACEAVGLDAMITSSRQEVEQASAVILPGVGAFGDAMEVLRQCDLIDVLKKAARNKTFMGICLGMQLIMSESFEFGHHQGLAIVPGSVVRFENPTDEQGRRLKVPQVGWNRIFAARGSGYDLWRGTPLQGLSEGEFMYFVHSFHVVPNSPSCILAMSRYGSIKFCSALRYNSNLFACQFHPERSGPKGLQIYRNFAERIKCKK